MIITKTVFPDGKEEIKTEYTFREFMVLTSPDFNIQVKQYELILKGKDVSLN